MYFGGKQEYGSVKKLFFAKSNGNGDNIVTTSVEPDTSDTFKLSRIILDKGKAFSDTTDILYFCGTVEYSATNSDFIYGYISSGDVNKYNNDTLPPL
jgi:hypothetical protein